MRLKRNLFFNLDTMGFGLNESDARVVGRAFVIYTLLQRGQAESGKSPQQIFDEFSAEIQSDGTFKQH